MPTREAGTLVLVNGTPYEWTQVRTTHSNQLSVWSFPASVLAGQVVTVHVEFDHDPLNSVHNGGVVSYQLAGSRSAFEIRACVTPQRNTLEATLQNLATRNPAQGSTLDLNWAANSAVRFVLAGTHAGFICNVAPVAWMQANLSTLGSRPLRHICMPGSHDAGMSVRNTGTAGAFDCNILTQTLSIGGQLAAGSRYFDIRPVISGGHFSTGHYSLVGSSWQGANGQSIDDVISQVNAFTTSNPELVVLNFSHDLNTDVGNESYINFTQSDWNRLFEQLLSLRNLYSAPNPTNVDLTQLPLNSFIGGAGGRAAVVIIFSPGNNSCTLGPYAYFGFYTYASLNAYNRYTGTNVTATMASDQLAKMRAQRSTPDSAYFLLSWTMTQSPTQAATCIFGSGSILQLAAEANSLAYSQILPACTRQTYPNIIFMDAMDNAQIVALCMSVNTLTSAQENTTATTQKASILPSATIPKLDDQLKPVQSESAIEANRSIFASGQVTNQSSASGRRLPNAKVAAAKLRQGER